MNSGSQFTSKFCKHLDWKIQLNFIFKYNHKINMEERYTNGFGVK